MICMMNVPYVVLKYATLLLSFPINNVVEVVLTTLSTLWKSTNNPSHPTYKPGKALRGRKFFKFHVFIFAPFICHTS